MRAHVGLAVGRHPTFALTDQLGLDPPAMLSPATLSPKLFAPFGPSTRNTPSFDGVVRVTVTGDNDFE